MDRGPKNTPRKKKKQKDNEKKKGKGKKEDNTKEYVGNLFSTSLNSCSFFVEGIREGETERTIN